MNQDVKTDAALKKRNSLTARTVRTVLLSSLVLGIGALFIGLSVYAYSIVQQYIDHAFETASHAWTAVTENVDSISLAKEVMAIYRSLTPEQKEKMESDPETYRSYFSAIDTTPGGGGTWESLVEMLGAFVINVDDVYLGMYDGDTDALVYFANADEEVVLYPGDWEKVPKSETRRFLNWDGKDVPYAFGYTKQYGWLLTTGYPIWDEEGKLCEFLLVDMTIENFTRGMAGFAIMVTVGILIITLIMAWFIRRRIKKTVAEPIDAIASAATEYVKAKQEGLDKDCFSTLNIKTGDELENLSRVMADMEKNLALHEEHIRAITAEKERINTELNMATLIQKSMIPQVFPVFPERHEFDIFASMDPAREVGGDFYDFYFIDDDHLCLVIADVSGKGVPGALFMMISKVILQSCAMLGRSAGEILSKTNEAICSNNKTQMFVTVWLGILEISTGVLTAANAAHEYPVICKKDGEFAVYKDQHGFVIGGIDGVRYKEYKVQLEPGDKLFVYTDGVPEATDANKKMFGMDRMLTALNENPQASPREILAQVKKSVDVFVGDAEQFDDLTMVCLQYKGN